MTATGQVGGSVLVLNAGSSSLKYQLLDPASGGCHTALVFLTGDPVAGCLRSAGQARADELADEIAN